MTPAKQAVLDAFGVADAIPFNESQGEILGFLEYHGSPPPRGVILDLRQIEGRWYALWQHKGGGRPKVIGIWPEQRQCDRGLTAGFAPYDLGDDNIWQATKVEFGARRDQGAGRAIGARQATCSRRHHLSHTSCPPHCQPGRNVPSSVGSWSYAAFGISRQEPRRRRCPAGTTVQRSRTHQAAGATMTGRPSVTSKDGPRPEPLDHPWWCTNAPLSLAGSPGREVGPTMHPGFRTSKSSPEAVVRAARCSAR